MAFLVHLIRLAVLCVLLCFKRVVCQAESASLSMNTDKDALLLFRSQITLQPSNPLSTWHGELPPCNWTGVVCNRLHTRVVSLNLSGLSLAGSISPGIGNLSFLRSLQLQNNQLRGPIPNEITNLSRLRVLNLSSNRLDGTIPSNLSNLAKLEVMDLMTNKITGRIPEELSHLQKLQILNLGKNHLYGSIPPSISNISSLSTLNLGTNGLSGTIPPDLSRLQNLKDLDVTINNLTGIVPPSLYNMSSLISLALASNGLRGEIPYDVGVRLPKLLVFNFCINKFTGRIPGSLHNLTNIKVIRMAHNLLEGTVPPGLGNLPYLEMYNIGYNKIVGSGEDGLGFISSLTNSTRLKFLAFDGNLFEGVIPHSIGNLSKVLSKLYMGENRFRGVIPPSIGQLSSLALLNMSYNSFSGEIPPEIGRLEDIQVLDLGKNQLSGTIPETLGNLHQLNEIDLSGNRLEGGIPASFGNFKRLLSMDLSNNRISGTIPREIVELPSLSTILNLSKNVLSGPVPQDIGRLESVVSIDLCDNQLSGKIPDSLKDCNSLEKLYMARNLLSGPIPNFLAELRGLEFLDLSSNQLSGNIPFELQNLQALKFLNFSFNKLQGGIPSGGVFRSASNVHLEGNPKLCIHRACRIPRGHGNSPRIGIILGAIGIVALCSIGLTLLLLRKNKASVRKAPRFLKEQHVIISYNELCRATGNFSQENLIGTGSFGSVYRGNLRGLAVAVKVLDITRTGYFKSFIAECEALRKVRHRNLVKLITACSSLDFKNTEFLALVYEFFSNGSLDDWITGKRSKENGDGLSITERLNIAIDIASAMSYLHDDFDVPVVHCDLKPSNILLDEDKTARVGDFGLARLLSDRNDNLGASVSMTHVLKGSIGYIPPEYGFGEKPSMAGDVYSFGVLLLELFTARSPTSECFSEEQNLISWVKSAFPKKLMRITDPQLVPLITDSQENGSDQAISDCLNAVFSVGLSCSEGFAEMRITMSEALRRLQTARANLTFEESQK